MNSTFVAEKYRPSTFYQITEQFEKVIQKQYNILILGNSRLYRGIDPEYLWDEAYNFAHDDDYYNQIYYKLQFVFKHGKKFEYLILGVDMFQFSRVPQSRNYVYQLYLNSNYREDYGQPYIYHYLDYLLNSVNYKKLKKVFSNDPKVFLKDRGQLIVRDKGKANDEIKRDNTVLDLQLNYFEKIITLCKDKGIKVYLIQPPLRQNELKNYDKDDFTRFNSLINNYIDNEMIFYFDYSNNHDFKVSDFTDITHLNESASKKLSLMISSDIISKK